LSFERFGAKGGFMRRAVLLLTVLLLVVLSLTCLAQISQVHLGWSQNDVYTTMTVLWYSPQTDSERVVYDESTHVLPAAYSWSVIGQGRTVQPTTSPSGVPITTTAFDGTFYRAELTGLTPGTTYYFRVEDTDTGETTREWTFKTIAHDQIVLFGFAGDSQRPFVTDQEMGELVSEPTAPANWPYMRDFITDLVARKKPDFMLALGDFVDRGDIQSQWTNWFDAWQDHAVTADGRMIPLVPVIGNHDTGSYPNVNASYEWFLGQFALPQPVPGLPCYSLDFPNLHVTVLAATSRQTASDWASAEAEAAAQTAWVTADLAGVADGVWKIVAFHYNVLGCYEACDHYPSDAYMNAWTSAFQHSGVDVVFMGHTHNYTRTWPVNLSFDGACFGSDNGVELASSSDEGITYITSGTWGGPANPIVEGTSCEIRPWIAAAASHPGAGLVRVRETGITILMTDTSGKSIDAFSLPYAPKTFPTPKYVQVIP
jgi:hypothetical protein